MKTETLSVISLFLLVAGIFGAAAENDTVNNTTGLKNASKGPTVQPLSFAVLVTAEPSTVTLGTVYPDGVERSYTNIVNVRVLYFLSFRDTLSVRASGDMINTANSSQNIPISNLKFSTSSVSKRSFTTSNYVIETYSGFGGSIDVPMSLYITVPPYTDPGTYSVTLIYTAT
ncbi:hypothetical protein [Methanothermobacter wolfeii]|uniref:hypothetical protein n=1 Tax=Methanothermobacter wolfeii TaxID=145261 RepID=UPI0024B36240|nr:hypothetical protein [Methanothermobacter wolfeii]MDI6702416.1 hypothetical protein [Methanothermobacter wolfeii]